MERIINHVSEKDSEKIDIKKMLAELFGNEIDTETVYNNIKDTSD